MGGYDLYGNYYANADDALNAEMAQCNEIDNRINRRKIEELERKFYENMMIDEEELRKLRDKIECLEERIKKLESAYLHNEQE